ncbi:hypothetical protein E2P81_ATG05870 [Venturia nashicola]|uniref:Uncharacterized protein n=1 Tax=Venturia nashicola TaxID=86259 RepID=A0A4Z1P3X9_9PEZI|nr:hypothetical protein E6O75_ATG06016 [Venturia nashicola]TLD29576.1 hypothetical protein E2P81_ATG05870 [Venturia nashicola]
MGMVVPDGTQNNTDPKHGHTHSKWPSPSPPSTSPRPIMNKRAHSPHSALLPSPLTHSTIHAYGSCYS